MHSVDLNTISIVFGHGQVSYLVIQSSDHECNKMVRINSRPPIAGVLPVHLSLMLLLHLSISQLLQESIGS
jgi:hypothetical protein